MERKIGETFEYEGKKLKVVEEERNVCFDCYFFDGVYCQKTGRECGSCERRERADYKPVIFVEADKEQHQDEQPQELNLCEVLEHCPKGEQFWSPMLGYVKLYDIDQEAKTVDVAVESGETWDINADGTITIGDIKSPEVMLYPSRTQRDWTKVKYEPQKERFDPKTLHPFDRVLVRDSRDFSWNINIYSNKYNNKSHPYQCITSVYRYCIPYNDETKHLVGTKDEAPEYYRYWED